MSETARLVTAEEDVLHLDDVIQDFRCTLREIFE